MCWEALTKYYLHIAGTAINTSDLPSGAYNNAIPSLQSHTKTLANLIRKREMEGGYIHLH